MSHLQTENFAPGEFIFFEGDIDYHFYIVQTGQIQIFTKDSSGQRINIATIEPGESFGEFAMLDQSPRSASAQALTNVSVYKITEEGYEQLLSELPIWASSMLRGFAVRLKKMNKALKGLP